MKKQTGVVITFFGIVLGISMLSLGVLQSKATTAEPLSNNTSAVQQNTGWEYARLVINDTAVTWIVGDTNFIPRSQTIAATNQQLGGKQPRANLANLLNTIGSSGWELVMVNGNTWIFKRIPKS